MKGSSLAVLAIMTAVTSPAAHADWKPIEGAMLTRWAGDVTPESTWQEYPRPLLERPEWTNLNGLWDYAVTPRNATRVETWAGSILVPFCPESALSGVGRLIEPTEALWYRRDLPGPIPGKRSLIHFEAVDYETTVWVNGQEIGSHRGGHTPFSFDLTEALRDGANELIVRVYDATGAYQLHGKQRLHNGGIWYTRVTGIWQTVWMESVPERSVADLAIGCDIASGRIVVTPRLAGPVGDGETLRATASMNSEVVASAVGEGTLTLQIPTPRLWSPDEPHLYDLTIELIDRTGRVVDSVASYAALREFGRNQDARGHWRFTLNGEPIFHWGPLDQGWWPDGLLTPPTDRAMRSDIEFLKAAGFNMIRTHIKVRPRRYYTHCDRIGMLVWQDQVSSGYGGGRQNPDGSSPPWTRMEPDPVDANWPDEAHAQWVLEYRRMVDHLRNNPCVAVWVPFNEAWGQHRSMEVGALAVSLDPSRPVNISSGGNFWPVGDIADHHSYPDPDFPLDDLRFTDFIKVVGEFGGHGWPVDGHLWDAARENWGYGGLPETIGEWKDRYARSIDILCALRRKGVAAGVYTQTTDVEVEINGLLTYDRIQKVDPDWLRGQSARLLGTPDAGTE
ncbi:MAG: glycoside hydrolase family 2 TIM barrel-domain containing protein [Opitutaceae bacterium]